MATPSKQGASTDFGALIATLAGQPDPLLYLTEYLESQRIPSQGPFFSNHALAALAIYGW